MLVVVVVVVPMAHDSTRKEGNTPLSLKILPST
jgi:hypothetical protein